MTRQFSILRRYREFLANQSGNFGIIFAICAFPAIGAASLALDYSNMSRERNMVQHSLDAGRMRHRLGGFLRNIGLGETFQRYQHLGLGLA